MSKAPIPPAASGDELLAAAGIPPHAAAAAERISSILLAWRRQLSKRELGSRALTDLQMDIDLAQLDVLLAIAGAPPYAGTGGASEVMVATVAERLGIDPSRASRLVSEVVAAGYARRAISQADARRAVVELTNAGAALVGAVRTHKLLLMGHFLASWDREELAAFLPLLERISRWSLRDGPADAFAPQLAALSASVANVRRVPSQAEAVD